MSSMPNSKLSDTDKQEISCVLAPLKGSRKKAAALDFANFFGVHISTIYAAAKSESPDRKRRSDAGRRKFDLLSTDPLKFAAELVANQKLAPELALETMHENADLFGSVDINLHTFRRYLREHGISRTQAKKNREPHRNFRAEFPGQIFQFDMSGVKNRSVDIRSRAIIKVDVLEVSKNHPSRRCDRIPLWKFSLVDDNSSKKFVRFVACEKPNTVHVSEFLKSAFLLMGLPFMLYVDRDRVINNKRTMRGAKFINEAFKDSGGFILYPHEAGNPQATGKVERTHQIVEEYEKLLGVKAEFGTLPNLDGLNNFADWLCDRYNNRVHRTTGIAPNVAFRNTTNPLRMINPEQFDAAFKARDLTLKVNADVTISVDGVKYQLSRKDSDPFLQLAATGQRIEVYWLDDEDFFACVVPRNNALGGEEYIVEKLVAKADVAFDYKTLPETTTARTRKELKRSQKERKAAVKAAQRHQDAPVLIVPGIDTKIPERAAAGVINFPQKIETGDEARLDELTHHVAAQTRDYSRDLDLLDALDLMQTEDLAPRTPGDELNEIKAWLRVVFNGREIISEGELRECLESKTQSISTPERKLRIA